MLQTIAWVFFDIALGAATVAFVVSLLREATKVARATIAKRRRRNHDEKLRLLMAEWMKNHPDEDLPDVFWRRNL